MLITNLNLLYITHLILLSLPYLPTSTIAYFICFNLLYPYLLYLTLSYLTSHRPPVGVNTIINTGLRHGEMKFQPEAEKGSISSFYVNGFPLTRCRRLIRTISVPLNLASLSIETSDFTECELTRWNVKFNVLRLVDAQDRTQISLCTPYSRNVKERDPGLRHGIMNREANQLL